MLRRSNIKALLLCSTLALLLSFNPSDLALAQNQNTRVIGLFPFQSVSRALPREELDDLTRKVLLVFERERGFQVVKKYPLFGSLDRKKTASPKQERNKALNAILQKLNKGISLLQNQNLESALKLFKEGLRLSAKNIRWEGVFPILTRFCALLALTYFELGESEKGEFFLRTLAKLSPSPLPPELQKNRQLLSLYHRINRDVLTQKRGEIWVTGFPEGAEVFVDGKKVGTIPSRSKHIYGYHYIRVKMSGYWPWGYPVELKDQELRIEINLKKLPPPIGPKIQEAKKNLTAAIQQLELTPPQKFAKELIGEENWPHVEEICHATAIEIIFSAYLKKKNNSEEEFSLFPIAIFCKERKVRVGQPLEVKSDFIEVSNPIFRALTALLREKTEPDATVHRPTRGKKLSQTTPPPTSKSPSPIYKKWWFWTLIGITTAGTAAAVTAAVVMNSPPKIEIKAVWGPSK